jgi:hypothetical protein
MSPKPSDASKLGCSPLSKGRYGGSKGPWKLTGVEFTGVQAGVRLSGER